MPNRQNAFTSCPGHPADNPCALSYLARMSLHSRFVKFIAPWVRDYELGQGYTAIKMHSLSLLLVSFVTKCIIKLTKDLEPVYLMKFIASTTVVPEL